MVEIKEVKSGKTKTAYAIHKMEERGFYLYSVDKEKIMFTNNNMENKDPDVIVEMYDDFSYNLFYTNEEMFGVLDSGNFENVFDDKNFEKIIFMFCKQIGSIIGIKEHIPYEDEGLDS